MSQPARDLGSRLFGWEEKIGMKKIRLAVHERELAVYLADTFWHRLRGLMLRDKGFLPLGTGLLIKWESHTCDFSHELGDQASQRI